MKYRYVTQVMTRHSGMLTIFCESREQATRNISLYHKCRIEGAKLIEFDSITNLPNITLMDEIIAVSVGDMEMLLDVHMHEIIGHKQMEQDIEFSLNKEDE